MKKIFSVFALVLVGFSSLAQDASTTEQLSGAELTFKETTFDFGDMYQGDKVEHTFAFSNTGTEPLILTNVEVQCGCTATKYTRDPIAPGGTGEITVSFNSTGKSGMQSKTVTAVSNAKSTRTVVRFTANVLPPKKDS